MDAYLETLILQIRRASRNSLFGSIKTIYIGGGTPTYFGHKRLLNLIYTLSLSINLEQVEEFSIEANPESLTEQMVKDLYALGVNRISLGAQSFDDADLSFYGRIHNSQKTLEAIQVLKTRFENFSLDLICGAQTQTLHSWEQSVLAALKTGAKHISIYPLTLEENTPLYKMVKEEKAFIADSDLQADMMLAADKILTKHGMQRYEVASYSYPHYESKHNMSYWTGKSYLGLGIASASMLTPNDFIACRAANLFQRKSCPDNEKLSSDTFRVRLTILDDFNAFADQYMAFYSDIETLTYKESLLEDIMLGFRMTQGVDVELVQKASTCVPQIPLVLDNLLADGLITKRNTHYIPTQKGWLCGNEIYVNVWNLAL